jgi:hypothetical protein
MNPKTYQAPPNKKVYRAEKKGSKGNWFALSKDDAIGYSNYGYKIISKSIGGKKFVYADELESGGSYFDYITKNYPKLFKIEKGFLWDDYELKITRSELWNKLKSFLKKEGYSGIFTGKKLSIDYELYLFSNI